MPSCLRSSILPLSRGVIHAQQQVTSRTGVLATVTFHVGPRPSRAGHGLAQLNLLHVEVVVGLTSPLFLQDRVQKLVPARGPLLLAAGGGGGAGRAARGVIGPGSLGGLHHAVFAHFAPQFFVLCTFGGWCVGRRGVGLG